MTIKLPPELRKYFSRIGSQGGKIGGPVRAARLSAKRRSEIARMGAMARIKKLKEALSK